MPSRVCCQRQLHVLCPYMLEDPIHNTCWKIVSHSKLLGTLRYYAVLLLSEALVTLRQKSRPRQYLPLRNMNMSVMKWSQQQFVEGKMVKIVLFWINFYHCFGLVSSLECGVLDHAASPSLSAISPTQETWVVYTVAFCSVQLSKYCPPKCWSASS